MYSLHSEVLYKGYRGFFSIIWKTKLQVGGCFCKSSNCGILAILQVILTYDIILVLGFGHNFQYKTVLIL